MEKAARIIWINYFKWHLCKTVGVFLLLFFCFLLLLSIHCCLKEREKTWAGESLRPARLLMDITLLKLTNWGWATAHRVCLAFQIWCFWKVLMEAQEIVWDITCRFSQELCQKKKTQVDLWGEILSSWHSHASCHGCKTTRPDAIFCFGSQRT